MYVAWGDPAETPSGRGQAPTAMKLPRHRLLVAAPAAGALLLLACFGARAGEEVLLVSGTGTALGTLGLLSAAFESANPGHRIQVLPSVGSSGAVAAVTKGALDVAISGRPLTPSETAAGLTATPYARTPFVFAVGPRTGVSGITTGELVRIYRGELTTWPSGERVRLVLRPRSDADDAILRAISPEMPAALDSAHAREGMIMALTNQECDDLLASTPGSIGPTSLTQILTEDAPIAALTWNGVAPTVPNLASGAYPLAKTLAAIVRAPPSPRVRRFLAFLASPGARKILEQTGNLPLPVRPPEKPDAGRR